MKKHDNATSLRAIANDAAASWRELDGIAKAKRATNDEATANRDAASARASFQSSPDNETREMVKDRELRAASTHREALEAEESAERARVQAISALDAAELAEGDELAIKRSPKRLHEDVVTLVAEEKKFDEQLAAVRRQRVALFASTFTADAAHAARRVEAGLPRSAPVPQPNGGGFGPPRPYLQVLAEHLEKGVPPINFAERIEVARAVELRIATDIEERRLEKEAKAKDSAEKKQAREDAFKDQQKATLARMKKQDEAVLAEAREREKLGADLLARRASGAS